MEEMNEVIWLNSESILLLRHSYRWATYVYIMCKPIYLRCPVFSNISIPRLLLYHYNGVFSTVLALWLVVHDIVRTPQRCVYSQLETGMWHMILTTMLWGFLPYPIPSKKETFIVHFVCTHLSVCLCCTLRITSAYDTFFSWYSLGICGWNSLSHTCQ